MAYFNAIKRETLFKGKYLYKIYLNFYVREINNKTIWHNKNHKKIMENIARDLKSKFGNLFKIYKNIVFCENLDVAFYLTMKNWDNIKRIEKAIIPNEQNHYEEKEFLNISSL